MRRHLEAVLPPPRRSPVLAALALAVGLVLAACGGSGDGEDRAAASAGASRSTSTTDPGDLGSSSGDPVGDGADDDEPADGRPADLPEADPCADLEALVLEPVVPDGDGGPEARSEADVLDALGRLAAGAPEPLATDAGQVLALAEAVEADSPVEQVGALAAVERMIEWAATECRLDGPTWGCLPRSTFTPVGEAIDGPGADDLSGARAWPTPEEAADPGGEERPGQRVEAQRSEDTVVFAWVDDLGLARSVLEVERVDGGWAAGAATSCGDGGQGGFADEDEFEIVGGSIEDGADPGGP